MNVRFHESSVTANGVRFHYATEGSGPLVLLLHGFPERWFSWRFQLPALAEAGYRAVAPDLRGYGLSDKPREGYDLRTLGRDVVSLIAALDAESATVIGHDWGGALTWEAVSRHPERIPRFAVLDCPHPAVMRNVGLRSPAQLLRSWYMFFFNVPWVPERVVSRKRGRYVARLLRMAAVDRTNFTRDVLDAYRESAARPEDVTPMLAYYREALRTGLHFGALADYPPIERPGLLLWAEEDHMLGNELIAPHTRYARNLRVRRIPRCGHFVQQERPETVNRLLLEWLADTR